MKKAYWFIVIIFILPGCYQSSADTSDLMIHSFVSLDEAAKIENQYAERLLARIERIAQERATDEDLIQLDSARALMKLWTQSDVALKTMYELMVEATGGYKEGFEGMRPLDMERRIQPNETAWSDYQKTKKAFLAWVDSDSDLGLVNEMKSLMVWKSEISALSLRYQQMLQKALLNRAIDRENLGIPVSTSFRIEYSDQEEGLTDRVVPVYRLNPKEMKVVINTTEIYVATKGLADIAYSWNGPLHDNSVMLNMEVYLKNHQLDTVFEYSFGVLEGGGIRRLD
jgi:hypothetical protein